MHPTCSSCQRRQLPCSYVNDPSVRGAGTGARKTSSASQSAASSVGPDHAAAPPAHGPPSSHGPPVAAGYAKSEASTSPPLAPVREGAYVLARADRNGAEHHHHRMDVDDTVKPPSAKRLRLDGGFEGAMQVAIPSQ